MVRAGLMEMTVLMVFTVLMVRRRYTPQRDESMRNSVEFAVTSAHAGARRLGLKTRGVLITSARNPKWAGIVG